MPPASPGELPTRRNREFWDRQYSNTRRNRPNEGIANAHNNSWKPRNALDIGLQPRFFEEIDSERAYLFERLQKQDSQALNIFGRLAHVDDQIDHQSIDGRDELKKAKKYRTWLKKQVKKTIGEERFILTRLGELHIEIQCRERWLHVQRDQEFREMRYLHTSYGGFPLPPPPFPPPFPPPGASASTPAPVAPPPQWSINPQPAMPFGSFFCPCGCNGISQQAYYPSALDHFHGSYQEPQSSIQAQKVSGNLPVQDSLWEATVPGAEK
ncbi:hypothetical protein F5X99DRAFT_406507 [Biscogniauxia marginata]|nr:hypothetical protein F5X99DRAFT_406507 [Biscogniauxia marginata]